MESLFFRTGVVIICHSLKLFEERLDGTILFDNFRIKGSIPECIKQRDWLIDKQGDNTALWNWIVNHFDDIKQEDGWGDNTDAYLRDIQNAYKAGGNICCRFIT